MIKPTLSINKTVRQYAEEPGFKIKDLIEKIIDEALEQADWKKDYIVDVQIDFIEVPK